MIGLLCVHFWIIQKRSFNIPDLYVGSKSSLYWYKWGTNWRTVAAWVLAITPSMPGFVASVNKNANVGVGGNRVFSLSFLLGFTLAAGFAYLFHVIWPYPYPDSTVEMVDGQGSEGESDDGIEKGFHHATAKEAEEEAAAESQTHIPETEKVVRAL